MTTETRDCRNCGGDGYTTDSRTCPACKGSGKMPVAEPTDLPKSADEWFDRAKERVEARPEVKVLVASIFEFAEAEGKLDQFLRALNSACHPTWFGKPAVTVLFPDFAPHSLYFEVYLRSVLPDLRRGEFLMNGGIIYHAASGSWSVHT